MPSWLGKLLYYCSKGIVYAIAKLYFEAARRGAAPRAAARAGASWPAITSATSIRRWSATCIPRLAQNMAKRELFSIKILDWYMRSIGTVIVDRGKGKQALLTAIELLKHGACVVIFPEGTRSVTGCLGQGHSGAVVMAMRTGCTIVPTVIIGSDKAMRKGTKGIRSHPVTVHFGEPYQLPTDR